MEYDENDPVSTFLTMDRLTPNMFHAIQLFVQAKPEDKEPIKLILTGDGRLFLPGVVNNQVLDKIDTGHLIGIFKGKLNEEEVAEKLTAMGTFQGEIIIKIWPCSREGVEYQAKIVDNKAVPIPPEKSQHPPLIFTPARKAKT